MESKGPAWLVILGLGVLVLAFISRLHWLHWRF
jgi:hypothetical protein